MSYPIRRIVAGVAGAAEDDLVLRESAKLAERTGAVLHLVHAFELPSLAWDAYGRMGYIDPQTLNRYASSLSNRIHAAVAATSPELPVEVRAIAAPPATVILDVAREVSTDLIVVGSTRSGAIARALLGTTAQRVLRKATAPVLLVRQPLSWPVQRVLLTTELTPLSASVHEIGMDVLEAIGGDSRPEVSSLMVVGPLTLMPAPIPLDQLGTIAGEQLDRFLAQRRGREVEVSGTVRTGEPAAEIVREADRWKPDFLVMGTHSRKPRERWLMGSVAEAALRDTSSNVIVIPAGMQDAGGASASASEGAEDRSEPASEAASVV
jgi:nucleotide-binding universal stress UspA family protein